MKQIHAKYAIRFPSILFPPYHTRKFLLHFYVIFGTNITILLLLHHPIKKILYHLSYLLLFLLILLFLSNNLVLLDLPLFDKYNSLLNLLLHIQNYY